MAPAGTGGGRLLAEILPHPVPLAKARWVCRGHLGVGSCYWETYFGSWENLTLITVWGEAWLSTGLQWRHPVALDSSFLSFFETLIPPTLPGTVGRGQPWRSQKDRAAHPIPFQSHNQWTLILYLGSLGPRH